MPNIRMTEEQVEAYGAWLKKSGHSTSVIPQKAIMQASETRLCLKKRRGEYWLKDNDYGPMEKDLPVIVEAAKITGETYRTIWVDSDDRSLRTRYKFEKDGTPILEDFSPADGYAIVNAICELPMGELLKYMGLHPNLDAYINRKIAQNKGDTPQEKEPS